MGLREIETKAQSETNNGDEDFIDMDVSSSSSSASSSSSSSTSSFISFVVSSPPHSREFEFQMCSAPAAAAGEPTTFPADELFYKGKLLPLHLPPRLQMVQKLLETSDPSPEPSTTTATTAPRAIFPRAVSPCESRRFSSSEIVNPDENFFELSSELKNFVDNDNPQSTLNKKIKQVKPSLISQKIKASRSFIMALFARPGCSDSEIDPKSKLGGTKYSEPPKKKNPFGKIESFKEFSINRGFNNNNTSINIHRRSFSGAIQRHCPTKCLSYSGSNSSGSSSSSSASSSFSFGSNGSSDLQILNRSSSASSEIDNSIEGAIAHCKQSFSPRKSNVSEGELCSSRSSISGERERTEISRILN